MSKTPMPMWIVVLSSAGGEEILRSAPMRLADAEKRAVKLNQKDGLVASLCPEGPAAGAFPKVGIRDERIVVGSMNPSKIEAVRQTLSDVGYGELSQREVVGFAAASGVREQPMGLEEIVTGAHMRALHALEAYPSSVAFGIESGVFLGSVGRIGWARERLLDVCACVIAMRGKEEAVGFSSAWALPEDVAELIVRGDGRVTMDDALVATRRTSNPRLGYSGGGIELLSKGRIDRTAYTAQAVVAALIDWTSSS